MAPLVMTFARWGMTNAAPEFCVDGNLRHVKEMLLPIPGREHHKWEKRIDHPDAIALEKSWEDRDALLSHIDALAAKVARLEGEQEQLIAAIEESNTAAKKATAGMNELFAGTRQIAERLGIHVAPND